MKTTKQCYGCKQSFRKEELISYASPNAKTMQTYCPACLKAKQERERFSDKVCAIFGIKSPGPRIWTERKRIKETYGYTDDVIITCLEYIYNVEHKKKLAESLCLVNPMSVERALAYKNRADNKVISPQNKIKEYVVPVREGSSKEATLMNPDDFLGDD